MAAALKKTFPDAETELVRGGRGDFIVTVDGRELWNKNASGRGFPEPEQIVEQLR